MIQFGATQRSGVTTLAARMMFPLVAGVALLAHSGNIQAQQDAGATSTGPGDWVAGDYPAELTQQTYLEIADLPNQGGAVRQYKVHVPPAYSADTPMPVVFCFHGLRQNAVMFCVNGANMVEKSDAEGFILVMPNGYRNSWNAGTCCGDAAASNVDDVSFVRAVFAEISARLNIDLTRVYATGLSNGGFMSYRLGCEASDIFVAIASGAGAMGMNDIGNAANNAGDFTACEPAKPVSVLHLHGTADELVSYSRYSPSLDRMAQKNNCAATAVPALQPVSGGDTTCVSYEGCPPGIEVTGCTVTDGGHVWFGSESCGTGVGAAGCRFVGRDSDSLVNTDVIWKFFSRHAR